MIFAQKIANKIYGKVKLQIKKALLKEAKIIEIEDDNLFEN